MDACIVSPEIFNFTVGNTVSTEILHIRKHVRDRISRYQQLRSIWSLTTVSVSPRIIIVHESSVFFSHGSTALVGLGLHCEILRSHSNTPHSVGHLRVNIWMILK